MNCKHCILIVMLAFAGCREAATNRNQIAGAPVEVEITPSADTLVLSDLFAKSRYVEMKGLLLGYVAAVKQTGDTLVVQSKVDNRDLHLFDKEGNYLRSVLHYGRAANEVIDLYAFCCNRSGGTIDVLCNYGTEIKRYPLDGKTHPQTVSLPRESVVAVNDMAPVGDSTYALYKDAGYLDSMEYKVYLYDIRKNAVTKAFLPLDKAAAEKISIGQSVNFFRLDGKLCFYETFQDGICEITEEGLRPAVAFRRNAYTVPLEELERCNDAMEFIQFCMESPYVWAHIDCRPCGDRIFSRFTYDREIYCNVIDLVSREAHSYLYIRDDLHSGETYPADQFYLVGNEDDMLICKAATDEGNGLLLLWN